MTYKIDTILMQTTHALDRNIPRGYNYGVGINEEMSTDDTTYYRIEIEKRLSENYTARALINYDVTNKRVESVSFVNHRLRQRDWYGGVRVLRGSKKLTLRHALQLMPESILLLDAKQACEANDLYVDKLRAERYYL